MALHIQIQFWEKEITMRVKKLNLNQTHNLMHLVKMKFETSAREQWFDGMITSYDGLKGKLGVYFPSDAWSNRLILLLEMNEEMKI